MHQGQGLEAGWAGWCWPPAGGRGRQSSAPGAGAGSRAGSGRLQEEEASGSAPGKGLEAGWDGLRWPAAGGGGGGGIRPAFFGEERPNHDKPDELPLDILVCLPFPLHSRHAGFLSERKKFCVWPMTLHCT